VETPLEVDVRDGTRLEARLALPDSPKAGLVISHPHPLYGGDMHNPVVVRVAEVAQGLGLATLRFNFRGVGHSGGVHGEGVGEQDDVVAALEMLAGLLPADKHVGLAGYSFGAWVSARVAAAKPALPALALVAPPLGLYDLDFLERVPAQTLLVAGNRDPFCPVEAIERVGKRLGQRVEIIEGAQHFFLGQLFPLGEVAERWIRAWARPGP
jgi:alpha/beta superfamily hydrolase